MEIVIAALNPNANEVKYKISDFLYHRMVLMVEKSVAGRGSLRNWPAAEQGMIWRKQDEGRTDKEGYEAVVFD